MKRIALKSLLALAIAGSSMIVMDTDAATMRYRQSGNWTDIYTGSGNGWANNDGSVSGVLPGASDEARINFGNNTVDITSAVPAVNLLMIGVDESGNVNVKNGGSITANGVRAGNNNSNATGTLVVENGGTVTSNGIFWVAKGGSNGVVDIQSGGTVNAGDHLWWGEQAGSTATVTINGTFNQTGGILGLGTTNAVSASGGVAEVTIGDGGVMLLNNISGSPGQPSIQAGSFIDITGTGELRLAGDFVGVLNNYIAANKIIGDGVAQNADLVVDLTKNQGFTTVYLVPEPSSLALLGLGGLLVARRRRSI